MCSPDCPSGLNHLKYRVQAFQLDAGVGGCKAPVGLGVVGVSALGPGRDLARQGLPVRQARSRETSASELLLKRRKLIR